MSSQLFYFSTQLGGEACVKLWSDRGEELLGEVNKLVRVQSSSCSERTEVTPICETGDSAPEGDERGHGIWRM
jgi:hypothetical protein